MSCVLTLALDDASQERFERLREQWFPPERNVIPAHLSLFHTLPETSETRERLHAVAGQASSFSMRVGELRSLGRGVAFFLQSQEAPHLHRRLSDAFREHLSSQDRQGFRPHVVVQNKVEAEVAKQTLAVLQAGFQPWTCDAIGLDLWRYMGGPWEHIARYSLQAAAVR